MFQEEEREECETVVCIQGAEERPMGGDTVRGEGGGRGGRGRRERGRVEEGEGERE